jgi:hypothetical protein
LDEGGAMTEVSDFGFRYHGWGWVALGITVFLLGVAFRQLKSYNRLRTLVGTLDPQSSFLAAGKFRNTQLGLTALILVGLAGSLIFEAGQTVVFGGQKVIGKNIFFVIDGSGSMNVEDFFPSRLEAVKRQIEVAVRKHPQSNAYGLAVFTDSLYILCPLTTDVDMFIYLLNQFQAGGLQSRGTRLSDALAELTDVMREVQKTSRLASSARFSYWVVFSDGEDFSKETFSLKPQDEFWGNWAFVGVGSDKAMPVPVWVEGRKVFLRDASGKTIMSRSSFGSLKSLAEKTGGKFFLLDQNPMAEILGMGPDSGLGEATGSTRLWRPQLSWIIVVLMALMFLKLGIRRQIGFWLLLMIPGMGFAYGPLTYFEHRQAHQHAEKGEWEEARNRFKSQAQNPDVAAISQYNRSILERQLGETTESAGSLEASERAALPSNPILKHQVEVYRPYSQGQMAMEQQQPEAAIEAFKEALGQAMSVPGNPAWAQSVADKARSNLLRALELRQQKQSQPDPQKSEPRESQANSKEGQAQELSPSEKPSSESEGQEKSTQESDTLQKSAEEARAHPPSATEEEKKAAEEFKRLLMQQLLKQEAAESKGMNSWQLIPVNPHPSGDEDASSGPQY